MRQVSEREDEIQKMAMEVVNLIADKMAEHVRSMPGSMELAYYLRQIETRASILCYLRQGLEDNTEREAK